MARVMSTAAHAGEAERALLQRLKALDDDWIVLQGALIEADDAFARAPFVLLNDRLGIIVAAPRTGDAASLAALSASLRHMLQERGIARRLGGALPIVALPLEPALLRDADTVLRRAFDAEPRLAAEPGWSRRVAGLLTPMPEQPRVARGSLELRAERADAWRVARESEAKPAATSSVGARVIPEDHVRETVRSGGASLWAGMAVALVVVGGVLVGMAALNHGGNEARPPTATTSR
jgi:hypothetical protein